MRDSIFNQRNDETVAPPMTPGGEDPPDTATMGPNPDSPSLPAIPLDDIQGTLHRWLVDATGADFDGLKGLNQRFSQAYRQAYNSRPVIENSENGPLDLEPLSPLIREVNEYALRRVLSHWNVLHRLSNEFGVALEIDQRTLSEVDPNFWTGSEGQLKLSIRDGGHECGSEAT